MIEADTRQIEEFMRDLDLKIAEEQEHARQDIERMRSTIERIEDDIRDRWHRCNQAIEPMRQQRDSIVKQIAAVKSAENIPTIFVPTERN